MSDYVEKTDLDDFIADSELNWSLYETMLIMETQIRFPKTLDTLKVFNTTYSILEDLKKDKQPQETITKYLSYLLFDLLGNNEEYVESLVCECLRVILTFSVSENPKYSFCLLKLKGSTNDLYHRYFDAIIDRKFEIESVNKEFDEIKEFEVNEIHGGYDDRINFYKRVLARFKRRGIRPDIVEQIEKEIELHRKWQIEEMMIIPHVPVEDSVTEADDDNNSSDSKRLRTKAVTSATIMFLLDKFQETRNADITKKAKLIAYLTDFSENTIRQWLYKPDLSRCNKKEIDKVNKILSELNIKESIN